MSPRPQVPAGPPLARPAPLARWLQIVCGVLAALTLAAAALTSLTRTGLG